MFYRSTQVFGLIVLGPRNTVKCSLWSMCRTNIIQTFALGYLKSTKRWENFFKKFTTIHTGCDDKLMKKNVWSILSTPENSNIGGNEGWTKKKLPAFFTKLFRNFFYISMSFFTRLVVKRPDQHWKNFPTMWCTIQTSA